MSGYYPGGVTGNEYEIAGAEREWTDTRAVKCVNEECSAYETVVDIELELSSYGSQEWATWTCESCDKDHEYAGDIEPDEYEYEGDPEPFDD